jgi:hypothetical protein
MADAPRLGPVLLLVSLLRARAATLAGQPVRATAWALLGVAASFWWPGYLPMKLAMEATKDG